MGQLNKRQLDPEKLADDKIKGTHQDVLFDYIADSVIRFTAKHDIKETLLLGRGLHSLSQSIN